MLEISISLFYGLQYLEHLDLSNNNSEWLNTVSFDSSSTNINGENHQVFKLKHFNLAQTKIRFFIFELYFPMCNNFYSCNPTFQLDYLNCNFKSSDHAGCRISEVVKPNNSCYRPYSKSMELWLFCFRVKTECDGTRAENRFGLPAKRTSPFISAGVSVQSAAGSWGVRISGSNAG